MCMCMYVYGLEEVNNYGIIALGAFLDLTWLGRQVAT